MNMPARILIADDHRLFRDGLRYILAQLDKDSEILEADRCDTALSIAEANPDLSLVMLDIAMPDMNGCDALRLFAQRHPALPVVILTASENVSDMRSAFDTGASGFIPKSSSAEVMLGALRLILAGGIYVPPSLAGVDRPAVIGNGQDHGDSSRRKLTDRQREVLKHLQEGLSNKEIATRLGLTAATVKVHMSAILKTLGARTRTEAVLKAQKLIDS
jgi:DNA-binding NarL/FixJ family response regulator